MSFEFQPNRTDDELKELTKATTPAGQVTSWSFSALVEGYEKCAHRTFLTRVKKFKESEEKDNTAADRGTAIHDLAEKYIKGEIAELPSELQKCRALFEKLQESFNGAAMYVEEDWGFTDKWAVTGYYAKDTWLRVKLDAMLMRSETSAVVYDWKTGKKFGNELKHLSQAQLYALAAFSRFPELQFVTVDFRYLDHGTNLTKTYSREQAEMFRPRWEERAFKMTTDTSFPPSPSKHTCRWCPHVDTGNCTWAIEFTS